MKILFDQICLYAGAGEKNTQHSESEKKNETDGMNNQ